MLKNLIFRTASLRKHWMTGYSLLAALTISLPLSLQAQNFPNRPIKLISGATAGSASDIVARSVAEKLQAEFGVPVVVENKAGAAGTLAIQSLLNAPADGHTVLVYTSAHTVLPLINKVSYDPLRDFSAVTPLAIVPNVMVVSPAKGYKTVKDVVEAAKSNPGQLNYASVGVGSATYMSAEKFKLATGINAVHVPYTGSTEDITETMAGRVDYFFAPLVSALPMIKSGKLLALAVGTPKRSAQLPDVPTLTEAGVEKADYLFWTGMLVPSKTPKDIVIKLNQFSLKALQSAEVKDRLAGLGAEPMPMSPDQFDGMIRAEMQTNAEIIKAANIQAK